MQTGQVFISHTSDLARFPAGRSFVQAAIDGVIRAGMAPVDMRYFAAHEGTPADYCQGRVRRCDAYVAVVGFRYGTLVPGEGVSFTELEFREATEARLPRLVFLLADDAGLPPELTDTDRGPVEAFRQRLRDSGLIARTFSSAAHLELEIFHSLAEAAGSILPTAPFTPSLRYSLPPDTPAFTGRAEELRHIVAAAASAAESGRVVAISAIDGMPGVGKTALAIHIAHRLRDRFPDRQLYVDLHGHTPGREPVLARAALAGLLTATGAEARNLPDDLEGRAAMWRDRMAGQRALLILDNAASSAQVAPLLPGGEGSLVLITSRRHLGDLPGVPDSLLLETLPHDQAAAMFLTMAPRAADAPAPAVAEVVRLAGCLPLAISLLARVYARHSSWTLADLTQETKARLLTLTAEHENVAAAFGVSYQGLSPGQQEFFRSLGSHPGTAVDAYAAAALAGVSVPEAGAHLDTLHGEGLLIETGYRRYTMHDLIRRYAQDLATADADPCLERLLDYYEHAAANAEARLARQARIAPSSASSPYAVPALPDRNSALTWARAERANLLACLDHVTGAGQHARVVGLTAGVAALLRHDGPWDDAVTRHAAAVRAARDAGDRPGQAGALNDLGAVRRMTAGYAEAAEVHLEALSIYRDLGDRLGEANSLYDLGIIRRLTGSYADAVEAHTAALAIYQQLGSLQGQAAVLNELGSVRGMTGDFAGAATVHSEALGIYRDLGDRLGESLALNELGAVRRLTGDLQGAADAHSGALHICQELGNKMGQGRSVHQLGSVRRLSGDLQGAIEALEEARRIYVELGDWTGQAGTLNELGTAQRLAGDLPAAAESVAAALDICREHGDRGGEVEVLNQAGALALARGRTAEAESCHQQSLRIAREIGSSWDEAHALAGLGRTARAEGRLADAQTLMRDAHDIFHRIGAAEAADLATELDAISPGLPTA